MCGCTVVDVFYAKCYNAKSSRKTLRSLYTYMHKHILYISTYRHTGMHTYLHPDVHAYIHTFIHTYNVHTNIYINNIHTNIHLYACEKWDTRYACVCARACVNVYILRELYFLRRIIVGIK